MFKSANFSVWYEILAEIGSLGCLVSCLSSCIESQGLPWWLSGKESACQRRRYGFHPWVGKIFWRRKWQPTPGFLPGKYHGQSSLPGYCPWGHERGKHDLVTKQHRVIDPVLPVTANFAFVSYSLLDKHVLRCCFIFVESHIVSLVLKYKHLSLWKCLSNRNFIF